MRLPLFLVVVLVALTVSISAHSIRVMRDESLSTTSDTIPITVISDTHLGGPWSNDARLTLLLDFLANSVQGDLVLLGDIYENWLHPSSAIPPVATQVLHGLEAFNQRLIALASSRNVTYVHGNHDDEVTEDVFQEIFQGKITYEPTTYSKYGLRGEHGHYFDFFCNPSVDSAGHAQRPFGYFVSRAEATNGGGKATGGGDNIGKILGRLTASIPGFMDDIYGKLLVDPSGLNVVNNIMMKTVYGDQWVVDRKTKQCYGTGVEYQDHNTTAWQFILNTYDLAGVAAKEKYGYDGLAVRLRAALGDYQGVLTDPSSRSLVTMFGHTHDGFMKAYYQTNGHVALYINSGTWATTLPVSYIHLNIDAKSLVPISAELRIVNESNATDYSIAYAAVLSYDASQRIQRVCVTPGPSCNKLVLCKDTYAVPYCMESGRMCKVAADYTRSSSLYLSTVDGVVCHEARVPLASSGVFSQRCTDVDNGGCTVVGSSGRYSVATGITGTLYYTCTNDASFELYVDNPYVGTNELRWQNVKNLFIAIDGSTSGNNSCVDVRIGGSVLPPRQIGRQCATASSHARSSSVYMSLAATTDVDVCWDREIESIDGGGFAQRCSSFNNDGCTLIMADTPHSVMTGLEITTHWQCRKKSGVVATFDLYVSNPYIGSSKAEIRSPVNLAVTIDGNIHGNNACFNVTVH